MPFSYASTLARENTSIFTKQVVPGWLCLRQTGFSDLVCGTSIRLSQAIGASLDASGNIVSYKAVSFEGGVLRLTTVTFLKSPTFEISLDSLKQDVS